MSVPSQWVRTKSDEAAEARGCYFDQAAAEHVRDWMAKYVRHSKGQFAGKPFELLDWQWDKLIAPVYGWKMPDGTRRFRRVATATPKKNGKSTLLAAIGLYMLCGDGEAGAEVYSAAADRGQASIIFNEAANMAEASDALLRRLKIKRAGKTITYPKLNGHYQALSADAYTKEGFNIHCLLFDELHTQKTRELWNTLRYGGAARRQPILWWISTAGIYDPTNLCYEQWQQAVAVQESRAVDISLHACMYETPESADWTSEEVWKAANPSYGDTVNPREMREAFEEAQASPVNENNFRRYRLNQWVRQERRWISMSAWDRCAVQFDPAELEGQKCWIGLDLATTTDICAAAILFKRPGGKFLVKPRFWVPESSLRRREEENRTRLDEWVRTGLIKAIPGDVIRYDVVRADLNEEAERYKVREFAIDPWNATQIATDLQDDGFEVTYVRTGYASISAASKEFEKLVLSGSIEHGAHPALDWMIGNIATEQDASGNIKPSKRKSAEKIDGVVAIILALARAIATGGNKRSVYETRGIDSVGGKSWQQKSKAGSSVKLDA